MEATMRAMVVGAGPAGLMLGGGLAGLGADVVVVDRDGGPRPDGTWDRRGVMQFGHAHGFRPQVAQALGARWPAAMATWRAAGAEPVEIDVPGLGPVSGGMLSRRIVLERALRSTAAGTSGLDVRQGAVQQLVERGGRVVGAMVDGRVVEADLVVDATGRSGRLGRSATVLGGDCGIAYVNRTYRLRAGAEPGPMTSPIAWFGAFDGYLVIVFPHERGHFSVVFVRPTTDVALKELRHDVVFDAACRAVPALAAWTDPERSVPTSPATAGGALRNTYHPQRLVPGLVSVGDAVATTAPTAGRGVAMAAMQVDELLRLLDEDPAGAASVAEPFGAWADRQIRPWVADHVTMDDAAALRWQGHDVDLSQPLPSDLVVAAAEVEPRLQPYVGPYAMMAALPASLTSVEPLAREVYRGGWRPAHAEGPGRDRLAEIIDDAHSAAA
jgi:2-polyprenyl-6-methoxyphenol hydroxylase-like FAD-dependent oxidoreductase